MAMLTVHNARQTALDMLLVVTQQTMLVFHWHLDKFEAYDIVACTRIRAQGLNFES